MKRRPALRAFLLLLPGLLAADRTDLPPALLFGAPVAALALFAAAGAAGRRRTAFIALHLLVPSLGLLHGELPTHPEHPTPEGPFRFAGRIRGSGSGGDLRLLHLDGGPLAGRLALLRPPEAAGAVPREGRVEGTGRVSDFPGPRNPGDPDFYAIPRRKGCAVLIQADSVRASGDESPLGPFRAALEEGGRRLAGREEGLFLALFLGRRDRLDPELVGAFRETGLAHLLALSGLHLGLFYGVVAAPLSLLPLPRRIRPASAVAILWIFGAAAHLPVSLFRALAVATLMAGSRAIERPIDRWNALGFAALAATAADPAAPWEISFRLTFSAAAGIAAVLPRAARLARRPLLRWIAVPLLVGLAAQTATAPATLHHFGTLAPFGAPLTLAASPLAALAIAAGSAWVVLGPWIPRGDGILESGTWGALALLAGFVDRARERLPGPPHLPPETADPIALSLLLLFLTPLRRRLPRGGPLLLLLPLVPLLFLIPLRGDPPLRIIVIDVGQGSAALAEFPGGETVLFDAGPRSEGWDGGARVVLPFLRRRGAAPVDLALISHPDGDHMGGALALFEASAIRRVADGGHAREGPLHARYDSLAAFGGRTWRALLPGAVLRFRRGVTIEALYAPAGRAPAGESNESSLVLLLRYRRFSMLFPGDAPPRIEEHLRRRGGARRLSVLLLPHHGARDGATTPFLREARPRAAIVSAGLRNRYGHPHEAPLRRLSAVGVPLFRTDRHGGVTVRTDGRHLLVTGTRPESPRLETELPARPRPFP
ncbi:MAG: ComEC/Rec2 family competence protein [Candidatus Eisenbacteria bacterium]